jgi:hypothetical protein
MCSYNRSRIHSRFVQSIHFERSLHSSLLERRVATWSAAADDEGGASWRYSATNRTRNWFENLTTGAQHDGRQRGSLEFCAFFYAETRFNTQTKNYRWSPPHPLSHWHNLLHQRRRQCRRFKAHFIFRRKLILPIILALTQSRYIAVNGRARCCAASNAWPAARAVRSASPPPCRRQCARPYLQAHRRECSS